MKRKILALVLALTVVVGDSSISFAADSIAATQVNAENQMDEAVGAADSEETVETEDNLGEAVAVESETDSEQDVEAAEDSDEAEVLDETETNETAVDEDAVTEETVTDDATAEDAQEETTADDAVTEDITIDDATVEDAATDATAETVEEDAIVTPEETTDAESDDAAAVTEETETTEENDTASEDVVTEDATGETLTTSAGIQYEVSNECVTIKGYTGSNSTLTIPSTIDGYPVAAIAGWAVWNNTTIRSLVLPSSLTSIGNYAFGGCTSLQSVNWGKGSTEATMGEGIFAGCTNLRAIDIPANYSYVSYKAFSDCNSLGSVVYNGNSELVASPQLYNSSFESCEQLTSVSLPNNLTFIGQSAFSGDEKLSTITLPTSLKKIDRWAFYGNKSLTKITIPNKVTEIGNAAFQDCEKLATVSIATGSDEATIGENTFAACKSLKSITLPANYLLSSSSFEDCTALTTVTYNSGSMDQKIPYRAFRGCTALTAVKLGAKVNEIGEGAFQGDTALKSVNIPSTVTGIGRWAFESSGVTSISIPAAVTNIGTGAFANCARLATLTMTSTAKDAKSSMGEYAFENCTALKTVTIPGRFDGVSSYAFKGCTALTSVVLSKGIYGYASQNIGWQSFQNCTALKKVTLPTTVGTISGWAFQNNTKLSSINLPEGLESIDQNAFNGDVSLTSVTIPSTVTYLGSYSFYKCTGLTSLTLKQGTDTAEMAEGAFNTCTALKRVVVPGNYVSVGSYAFADDTKLQSFLWKPANMTLATGNQKLYYKAFQNDTNLTSVALSKDISYMDRYIFDNCNAKLMLETTSNATTVKNYATEYKLKVTNGISAPALVKATAVGSTQARLSWNYVAGADGYIVYLKNGSSYSRVTDTTSNTFTTSYSTSKGYTYVVKAYGKVLGSTTMYSGYSSALNVGVKLSTPTSLKAVSKSYNSIKLSWKKVTGAGGYYIYQKSGSKWKKISTIKNGATTSKTISKLTCGTKYTYTVQAYYTNSSFMSYSKYNTKGVSVKPALPAVNLKLVSRVSSKKAKVSWSKTTGASGYEVYRSTSKKGTYKKIATITKGSTTSYTDKTVKTGKTYYYKVRAYRTVSKKKITGAYSAVKSVKIVK